MRRSTVLRSWMGRRQAFEPPPVVYFFVPAIIVLVLVRIAVAVL